MTIDVTPETPQAARRPERGVTLALLIPLVLATIAGLVALWPSADALSERESQLEESAGWHTRTLRATLTEEVGQQPGTVEIRLADGNVVSADPSQLLTLRGLEAGTPVIVMATAAETWTDTNDEPIVEVQYWIQDVDRSAQMRVLAIAAGAAIVVCGLWRGLRALIVLAVAGTLIWYFLIPHLVLADTAVWAIACLGAAICVTIALVTHGLSRRGAVMAWALLAGTAVIGVLAWLVIDYAHLNTGLSIGSTAYFYYIDDIKESEGLYLTAGVLAGLAALSIVVAEQVRILIEEPDRARSGPVGLMRAGTPALQRGVLLAGLLGLAFVLGPLLARYVTRMPGAGLQYSSDLELGLVLVVCASLGLAVAAPVTAAVALALGRLTGVSAASQAATDAAPPEPAESTEPGAVSPASPAPPTPDPGEDDAPAPTVDVAAETPRPSAVSPPEIVPPAERSAGLGELQPARRERPESAYRRPQSPPSDGADQLDGGTP